MLCCCASTSDSEPEEKSGKYKKTDLPKGELISSSSASDKGEIPVEQSDGFEGELNQDKTTPPETVKEEEVHQVCSPPVIKNSENDKLISPPPSDDTVNQTDGSSEVIVNYSPSNEQVVDTEITCEELHPVYAEGPKRESLTDQEHSNLSAGSPAGETQEDYIVNTEEEFEEMSQEALQAAVVRLEGVANRLESLAARVPSGGASAAVVSEDLAQFVVAFDAILNGDVATFMTLSNQIGDDVAKAAALVNAAFQAERSLLLEASKSKKPDDATFMKLLGPLSQAIQEVSAFKDSNRTSKQFNHLSTLADAIGALGWVTVSPTPGPYCKEMADAGMFYGNRVLKEYKEKDETHVKWARGWQGIMTTLQKYIKDYHTTGVSWNPQGGDAPAATSSAPAPPPGGPPAPPPPPPVLPPAEAPASSGSGGNEVTAALFADINKGADITKGLKKVSDDMKTHKNPELRQQGLKKVTDNMKTHKNPALRQGPVPFKATAPKVAPKPAPKAAPKPAAKPPVTELQDKKWIVEYHNDNPKIEINGTELKQIVYVFKCTNTNIIVKNKINSIILDSCKKVAIVFDDLVSSLEFINCQSVQGQVTGKVPTVSIDKTDGCILYLSEQSLDTEIVTAKSSEMNVCVPKGDGDFTEFALPEQFKTTYANKKMTTVCTDSI